MPENFFTDLSNAIIALFTANAGFFTAVAVNVFRLTVVLILMLFGAETLLSNHFDTQRFVRLVFMILVVFLMVTYYSQPIPWLGMNMHQLIPDEARLLSNQLEGGVESAVQTRLNAAYLQMESPSWGWGLAAVIYYMGVVMAIALMKLALIAIIGLSFVVLGILTLLGPLFLNSLLWPGLEFIFWGWFKSLLQYAAYQVVASATVFVAGHVLISFLDANPGPYTLGNIEGIFLKLITIVGTCAYILFKVPSITSSIFSGRAGESVVGERHA